MKIISWWSAGVTSAVATKLAIEKYGKKNVLISYQETGQAHPDNKRFMKECEEWYGKKISPIQSIKYKSAIDVARKRKYVAGANGNPCTDQLKISLRQYVEKFNEWDHQVFGFEYNKKEINRAIKLKEQYPETKAIFPLIDKKLTKPNALFMLEQSGIKKPAMYELGFSNNNCIGCLKADSQSYWAKMFAIADKDKYFKKIIAKLAMLENEVGYTIMRRRVKGKKEKIFLKDFSRKQAKRNLKEIMPECGVLCAIEFENLIDDRVEKVLNGQISMDDIW